MPLLRSKGRGGHQRVDCGVWGCPLQEATSSTSKRLISRPHVRGLDHTVATGVSGLTAHQLGQRHRRHDDVSVQLSGSLEPRLSRWIIGSCFGHTFGI